MTETLVYSLASAKMIKQQQKEPPFSWTSPPVTSATELKAFKG